MAERGRPRSFDRTAALDAALTAFWRAGFEATSMNDLVDAMGINSASIYAAYGSKERLFSEAVQRYRIHHAASLLDALNESADAASGLAAMFEAAIDLFTRPNRPHGCFIVTAAGGNAPPSRQVQEALASLRRERSDEIAARIYKDVAEGRLRSDISVQPMADMYAAILQGIALAARDGISKERLFNSFKPSMAVIQSYKS